MILRLAFMGSAGFSVPAIEALLDVGHEIAAVYTQPPKPAGRGYRLTPSPVHALADARGLVVCTPKTLRSADEQMNIRALGLDAAVVAAYGLILPQAVLDAPRLGCLNVHASLLPRWRGAAPIQRAILEGDSESGVTIMQMEAGLDTGPMLLQERVVITAETTASSLHDTLAELGARLIVHALDGVATGRIVARRQGQDGVTYAKKLDRDEGRLDWRQPAALLDRMVRALNPAPGVWFEHVGERIKVLAAEIVPAVGEPGTVLDEYLTVACAEGALRPTTLQRAGRAPVSTAAFLRGYPLPFGTRLSKAVSA